jgi:hypothetical protein
MTFPLSDLLTVSERDEILAELLSIAASLGAPTTSWSEGDATLTQLMTVSQKLADLTVVAVDITKGGFGELLPSDAWADRWALSRFNITRVPAKAAAGAVIDITCTADAAAQTYQLREIIIAHDTTGKTYRNDEVITLGPSVSLTGKLFSADEAGSASTAAPGAITTVVSALVGVSVTNTSSMIGSDQETTMALVTRGRAKLSSLSPNGPKDAYDFVARTPYFPDGTPCAPTSTPITRTRTVVNETTGEITVYCATAAGAPSGGDVAIVQTAIDSFAEPWGVTATAVAGNPHVIDITYQSWVQGSNLTTGQIETAQANALASWFALVPFGGYVIPPDTGDVYVEALEQVIAASVPGTVRVVVSIPAAKVDLTPDEIATLGTLTPTTTIL